MMLASSGKDSWLFACGDDVSESGTAAPCARTPHPPSNTPTTVRVLWYCKKIRLQSRLLKSPVSVDIKASQCCKRVSSVLCLVFCFKTPTIIPYNRVVCALKIFKVSQPAIVSYHRNFRTCNKEVVMSLSRFSLTIGSCHLPWKSK